MVSDPLRLRKTIGKTGEQSQNLEEDENKLLKQKRDMNVSPVILFVFIWITALWCLIYLNQYSMPKVLSEKEAGLENFSEERARRFLSGLTQFGSRIVGSHQNEVLSKNYLINEIENIQQGSLHKIEISQQKTSGQFNLNFLGGFTNVYSNIQNIAVKISFGNKRIRKKKVGLVNCHFDSSPNSPGASDDAVSCASMLELLSVLSQTKDPENQMRHDFIFLFNGAEETILQGSHGFVTTHPWARDVGVFINLEAAGAGGKELVFQTTQGHSWLINLYQKVCPHPHASILAQEIFQSGLIPSDTDFRIFRDFLPKPTYPKDENGERSLFFLPGLDIAFVKNGYVYHTPHDSQDKIQNGSIQREGENILNLLKALSTSMYLSEPRAHPFESSVFFDIAGLLMVSFSSQFLFLFNYALIFLLFFLKFLPFFREQRSSIFASLKLIGFCWLSSIVTGVIVALFLDRIGLEMSWFTNCWLLIGLFGAPCLCSMLYSIHYYHLSMKEQRVDDAYILIFSFFLLLLTLARISSSFIITTLILSLLLKQFFSFLWPFPFFGKKTYSLVPSFILHFLSSLPSSFFIIYSLEETFSMFIPLMSRSGPDVISDLVLALLVSFSLNFCLIHHLSLLINSTGLKKLALFSLIVFLLFFFLILVSPLKMPFSSSFTHPSNKRIFLQHLTRKIHHEKLENFLKEGKEAKGEGFLVAVPLDRSLLKHLGEGGSEKKGLDYNLFSNYSKLPCSPHPYCGWSFYLPLINLISQIYYQPATALSSNNFKVKFSHPKVENDSKVTVYNISFNGPNYMTLFYSLPPHTQFISWNLENEGNLRTDLFPVETKNPKRPNYKEYFVFVTHASQSVSNYNLSFSIKYSTFDANLERPQLAIASHIFNDKVFKPPGNPGYSDENINLPSPLLHKILTKLPPWVSPLSSVSSYESWVL